MNRRSQTGTQDAAISFALTVLVVGEGRSWCAGLSSQTGWAPSPGAGTQGQPTLVGGGLDVSLGSELRHPACPGGGLSRQLGTGAGTSRALACVTEGRPSGHSTARMGPPVCVWGQSKAGLLSLTPGQREAPAPKLPNRRKYSSPPTPNQVPLRACLSHPWHACDRKVTACTFIQPQGRCGWGFETWENGHADQVQQAQAAPAGSTAPQPPCPFPCGSPATPPPPRGPPSPAAPQPSWSPPLPLRLPSPMAPLPRLPSPHGLPFPCGSQPPRSPLP